MISVALERNQPNPCRSGREQTWPCESIRCCASRPVWPPLVVGASRSFCVTFSLLVLTACQGCQSPRLASMLPCCGDCYVQLVATLTPCPGPVLVGQTQENPSPASFPTEGPKQVGESATLRLRRIAKGPRLNLRRFRLPRRDSTRAATRITSETFESLWGLSHAPRIPQKVEETNGKLFCLGLHCAYQLLAGQTTGVAASSSPRRRCRRHLNFPLRVSRLE